MPQHFGRVAVIVLLSFVGIRSMAAVNLCAQGQRAASPAPPVPSPVTLPRFALVVGNAAYTEDIGQLRNPGNDATDMAATLRQLGFQVTLVLDADKQGLVQAVEAFSRELRPKSVRLFYFAGHGAVGPDGLNYLVPVQARMTSPVDIQFQAVAAEWVVARFEEVGPEGVNIFILDACRNAPFRKLWRAAYSGFTTLQGGQGSFMAYATAPGKLADDGDEQRNGLYTKHLLRFITQPQLSIERLFKQVRLAVEEESRAKHPKNPQIPWESSSLREEFSFSPPPSALMPFPLTPGQEGSALVPPPPASEPSMPAVVQAPATGRQMPAVAMRGDDGAEMVLVPGGAFFMGNNTEELGRLLKALPHVKRAFFDREMPQHQLFLDAFYIDKYEVTNARFQQFVQATGYRTFAEREDWGWVHTKEWVKVEGANWRTPHGPKSSIKGLDQHPVVQVSWEDARAYCAWAGKRLPAEVEWEKAARGPDGSIYPWGNTFHGERGNFCDRNCEMSWQDETADDGYRYTAPVGSYEGGKSPYGAYDLAGNVWEWVADFFDPAYYSRGPARSLQGPASGDMAVLRGGSWLNTMLVVRALHRGAEIPTYRFSNTGLRCVKSS